MLVSHNPVSAFGGSFTTSQQMANISGLSRIGQLGGIGALGSMYAVQQTPAQQHLAKVQAVIAALTAKAQSGQALTAKEQHLLTVAQAALPGLTAKAQAAQSALQAHIAAQAAKTAAKATTGCPQGQKAHKCNGQTICVAPGERYKCVKGQKPQKVSAASDNAAASALQTSTLGLKKQVAQLYQTLANKSPVKAEAFRRKWAAKGVTLPAATPAQAKLRGVNLGSLGCPSCMIGGGGLIAGYNGALLASMGQTYCDDGSDPTTTGTGLCADGTAPSSTPIAGTTTAYSNDATNIAASANCNNTSLPSTLTTLVNSTPPANCTKNPSKPACIMYQMSTNMQQMMLMMYSQSQCFEQMILELVQTMQTTQQQTSTTASTGCPTGYVLDPMGSGQCVPSTVAPTVAAGAAYPGGSPGMTAAMTAQAMPMEAMPGGGMPAGGGAVMPTGAGGGGGMTTAAAVASASMPGAGMTAGGGSLDTSLPMDVNVPYGYEPQGGEMDLAPLPYSVGGGGGYGGGDMIPTQDVNPGYGYEGGAMMQTVPPGFDLSAGDMSEGSLPMSLPVSQGTQMNYGGVPTTDQFSAIDLSMSAGTPDQSGGQMELDAYGNSPAGFQVPMTTLPTPGPQVMQSQVANAQTAPGQLPPSGAPTQGLPMMPTTGAPLPPQRMLPPSPNTQLPSGMIQLSSGGANSANSPIEDQGQIMADLTAGTGYQD
jgi:hypothetical protein